MINRQVVKRLREQLQLTLDKAATIDSVELQTGYRIEVGNASFDPSRGTVTFKVTLTQKGKAAEAQRSVAEDDLWNMIEWKGSPLHGKRGSTFKGLDGRTYTMVSHTKGRKANIIARRDDGKEFSYPRTAVERLVSLG